MNDVSHRYATLPNLVSAIRILLLPPLLFFFRAEMFLPTLGLFLISAGSDALDGAIARRWKMQSEFGRVLDPLADKVTFVTLIVVFSRNVLPFLPVLVLIVMEIILLVVGACTYFSSFWKQRFTLGANIYGKIKACGETLLVVLLIMWHFFPMPDPYRTAYFFSFYLVLLFCIIFALKSIVGHIRSRPLL